MLLERVNKKTLIVPDFLQATWRTRQPFLSPVDPTLAFKSSFYEIVNRDISNSS